MRKEVWFGLSIMAAVVILVFTLMPAPSEMTNGHLGLLMLALIVVCIMLGFPTAFTLMGMGVFFAWLAYRSSNPELAMQQTLDLMVQRAYAVMSNDVLIAVPLFVFMGYLVERAALIDRLFKSLHLAMARVPGSLAVATIITCAIFATATGIVGAVVTLMGLLALPAMLKAGYNVKVAAGAITAGGCLGILIPPSVLLIVYGATAGVSVVQLYAGAFFPGIMLASLYVGYVILIAKLKPDLMPPLPESERRVELPPLARELAQYGRNALAGLWRAGIAKPAALAQFLIALLPLLFVATVLSLLWNAATAPVIVASTEGLVEMGSAGSGTSAAGGAQDLQGSGLQEPPPEEIKEGAPASTEAASSAGLAEPPASSGGLAEPPASSGGLAEPPASSGGLAEPPPSSGGLAEPPPSSGGLADPPAPSAAADPVVPTTADGSDRLPAPTWFWILSGIGIAALAVLYRLWSWERLEIFKMLLTSFFPLAVLILAVLGSIVFGLTTPSEAAAIGALGGFILAAAYRFSAQRQAPRGGASTGTAIGKTIRELGTILKESSFLTAKTSAMVCWLFVGSSIFSAAFALLGGQQVIETWVLSLDMTPIQFMILAQIIIFLLGWPLEWTEIIVIFMPIFIPLLPHFNIDPLFFGLLVALNLQTAFLSPPVAMAAFYLKGVSPPHVTLNQIFAGMMPYMGIQIIALVLLYTFPAIGLWLPNVLYK